MKSLILFLGICIFCACQNSTHKSAGPISDTISSHIKSTCKDSEPCTIDLNEITAFSWDKGYFFDMSVENDVISKVIGEEIRASSNYYSTKLVFVREDKVVESEQHIIPEVDNAFHDGDVDFGITNSQTKYLVFNTDSKFEVDRLALNPGEFYRLRCINCE